MAVKPPLAFVTRPARRSRSIAARTFATVGCRPSALPRPSKVSRPIGGRPCAIVRSTGTARSKRSSGPQRSDELLPFDYIAQRLDFVEQEQDRLAGGAAARRTTTPEHPDASPASWATRAAQGRLQGRSRLPNTANLLHRGLGQFAHLAAWDGHIVQRLLQRMVDRIQRR